MSGNSITSQDLSIAQIFQKFYRVPNYQREYVWGEPDAKGERGEEVEQFLKDIHAELSKPPRTARRKTLSAPSWFAPESTMFFQPD